MNYENFVATNSIMIPYTTPNAISVRPSIGFLSIICIIAIARLIIAPIRAPLITGCNGILSPTPTKKPINALLYTINAKSPAVMKRSGFDPEIPIVPYAQNSPHNSPYRGCDYYPFYVHVFHLTGHLQEF